MARDILAVPIAGVGIEYIFSIARDVIPYRRNRLKGSTIRNILILKRYQENEGIIHNSGISIGKDNPREDTGLAEGSDRYYADKIIITDNNKNDIINLKDKNYNSVDKRLLLPRSRNYIIIRGSKRVYNNNCLDITRSQTQNTRTYVKRLRTQIQ